MVAAQPALPLTIETLRTTHSAIESMKHRGSLTSCKAMYSASIPLKDGEGNIYAWSHGLVETGEYDVTVIHHIPPKNEETNDDRAPAHKPGIHKPV